MSIAGSSSIADRFVRTTAFLLAPSVRVVGAGLFHAGNHQLYEPPLTIDLKYRI